MADMFPIQSSFAAGEISPKLYGRFDTPGYQQGLQVCKNVISDSRGSLFRRPGFQFKYSITASEARLFSFTFSRDEPFLMMFTDKLLTISASNAGGLGTELLLNNDFLTDGVLTPWADLSIGTSTVEVVGGACVMVPGSGDPAGPNFARISQPVAIPTVTDYKIRIQGNFTGPVGSEWQVWMGSTPGGAEFSSDVIPSGSTYFELDYPEVSAVEIYVTVYAPGWDVVGNPDTSGNVDAISFKQIIPSQALVGLIVPYLANEVTAIRGQMSPDGLYMIMTHPRYAPQFVQYDPVLGNWTTGTWSITNPPAEWTATSGNYPTTMAFFQGRSWWGGCKDDPETIWASVSGVYFDLTIADPIVADSALKFIIAEHGQIMWLEAGKDLLVGTALREFIITSVDGVIWGGDIQVEQQSAYGSAPIQPELMGNEVLFLSAITTKVRSMWYQWTESGYLARDLTYTNDFITRSGVKHLTYQRDPDQRIWLATNDGNFIGCSYHKDGNDKPVYGWHSHALADHTSVDMVTMYSGTRSDIVVAGRTVVNGTTQIHVMMASINPANSEEGDLGSRALDDDTSFQYMDDYVVQTLAAGQTVITGLEHLEGKSVTPLVDGAVQTNKVVSGGSITLDETGTTAVIGLLFTSKVKTLPQIVQAQGGGSTAQHRKRRNKIYVRMVNSALPLINGQRGAERHPSTPMNTGEPLHTGDVFISDLGWSELASVTIEQDLPYPMNLVAIFGEMAQENL